MKQKRLFLSLCPLLIASLLFSCVPAGMPTVTQEVLPTPTLQGEPTPPVLAEVSPLAGSGLGLNDSITFYFSEDMDRASVEAALTGLPAGSLIWTDGATLLFTPEPPLTPNIGITIEISTSAHAATGISLEEPLRLSYTVADSLRIVQVLPPPDSLDVNPINPVAVTFNQPVVSLGTEEGLPPAFTLEPAADGRGEWLNTSTFVFTPDPSLGGGLTYTVGLNSRLTALSGGTLDASGWSFQTALPKLLTVEPATEEPLSLDAAFTLGFNQPMDRTSVENAFALVGPNDPVAGAFEWNQTDTSVIFTPSSLLDRSTDYNLLVSSQAATRNGTALPLEHRFVYRTSPSFAISGSDPIEGGFKELHGAVEVFFTSPVKDVSNLGDYVTIEPEVPDIGFSVSGTSLNVFGFFTPETEYILRISPALADEWDQPLDVPFALSFQTQAAAPRLHVPTWSNVLFVRADEPVLHASLTNVQTVDTTVAELSVPELIELRQSYDAFQAYQPVDPVSYSQSFSLPPSRSRTVTLPLTSGNSLTPGLYYVRLASPQVLDNNGALRANEYIAAVSNINLTFKLGATEALVWGMDLRDNRPVSGAPVTLYDGTGAVAASGETDNQGIWYGELDSYPDENSSFTAVLGRPGDATFGLALPGWNFGVSGWDFGIQTYLRGPKPTAYMYSDRPIYRPGQTVYFRGVVRQSFNGRYDLPDFSSISLDVRDPSGRTLKVLDLPLSPFGTFHGEYDLPEEALPGYYSLVNTEFESSLNFNVAEYRKPEIELNLAFTKEGFRKNEPVQAESGAAYYFGAPAGDLEVRWDVFVRDGYFDIPGYQTGLVDMDWMLPPWARHGNFGERIQNGTGRTAADGSLLLDLENIPPSEDIQRLTLEMVVEDESGLPLSNRAETLVHPAEFYIGLKPDRWVGQSGTAIGFEVLTTDWEADPSPSWALAAEFKKVTWRRVDPSPDVVYGVPAYQPEYTPIASSNFTTGIDGKARLSFTPPYPGTYMLDVFGGGARSQVLLWVGGVGEVAWPDLSNQQMRLVTDKDSYLPGESASVFIPNEFNQSVPALLTVERGTVLKAESLTLNNGGRIYTLPLTDAEAPNVYVSVTVLGPENEFRQGYAEIKVQPQAQELTLELTAVPEINQPRGEMTLNLKVTDSAGAPVQGEFSLAVVDKAVLALADPNSQDILSALYGGQPLGIQTGTSLVAYSGRYLLEPPGLGGGGGGVEAPSVREDFPDTAYWNPTFITDEEGLAQVVVTLPDSLTTWNIQTRGLTVDTRVGQAEAEVVSTKSLLVRPVTPRFLVAGDHMELAAIVHNNTGATVDATVTLEGSGFTLDSVGQMAQSVSVPANGRARVSWWGTADSTEAADLTFSVNGDGMQDAAKPALGPIPIRKYLAPGTFVTAGVIPDGGSVVEVISLPRSFDVDSGGFDLELAPSLAASILTSLEAMPEPASTRYNEIVLSYLLPNMEIQRALQLSGEVNPEVQARLDTSIETGINALIRNQNDDGGWGWTAESPSDAYISAYILFGMGRARDGGILIPESTLERAYEYLRENVLTEVFTPGWEAWQHDRLTFVMYALMGSGGYRPEDAPILETVLGQRDQLSPWGKALLALCLEISQPGDTRVGELLNELSASAIRTASSAHWESQAGLRRDPATPLYTTAVVAYALAQRDPASPVLIESVRYLASHRDARGLWGSTYESAWVTLALTEAMKGFGELQADYTFYATLNSAPLASGAVSGTDIFTPVTASVPLEFLSPRKPNALTINRENGLGRLYYRAALLINRPVEDVTPLNRGMSVERLYFDAGCQADCAPLTSLDLASVPQVTVRLTLSLPDDAYYLMLEDHIPAGAEILDQNLKTSQQAVEAVTVTPVYDDQDPFAGGWGWWYFNTPQVRDDGIMWTADYLPAGTYELTYTLLPVQAGEFRVLPAHAWQAFFPEVQGTSAGTIFEFKP
jgi:uncharacterized protein YfaS (alpha-2-macroglobulin family)